MALTAKGMFIMCCVFWSRKGSANSWSMLLVSSVSQPQGGSKSVGFEADEAAIDISTHQHLAVIAEPLYTFA